MRDIIIDIREEHELKRERISDIQDNYVVYHIPQRFIGFNEKWIKEYSKKEKVYILCKSGKRSKKIKETYFKNEPNVIVLDGGIDNIQSYFNDTQIQKNESKFHFAPQQYMMMMFILILLVILYLHYSSIPKIIFYSFILFVIFFILIQILTRSCLLTRFIPLYKDSAFLGSS
jgi:rhodanese-related sulfurtransferase